MTALVRLHFWANSHEGDGGKTGGSLEYKGIATTIGMTHKKKKDKWQTLTSHD